jgi:hypothetical protein
MAVVPSAAMEVAAGAIRIEAGGDTGTGRVAGKGAGGASGLGGGDVCANADSGTMSDRTSKPPD